MSDQPAAPAADAPRAEIVPATIEDNAVVFTIGGHPFRVPVPTLWDAKQAPGRYLSAEQISLAEQAIDAVLADAADAAALDRDALLHGCSLGEALQLGESLRQLYGRAGLPIDSKPLATAA